MSPSANFHPPPYPLVSALTLGVEPRKWKFAEGAIRMLDYICTVIKSLKIIPTDLFDVWLAEVNQNLEPAFFALQDAEISDADFSFYTSVASVFSSKIEGENIDLDSYVKHRKFGIPFLPDYTKRTDDLYAAYVFAQANPLTENNLAQAHKLLSNNLLDAAFRGKVRHHQMMVTDQNGRIEYVATQVSDLQKELKKFYHDLSILLQAKLTVPEAFFFASLLHLVFVKIHPWLEGNGRCSRLLEKWFLAEKLGNQAWFLESEKHYFLQRETYYKNLRVLGLEYEGLDYGKALPFLLMLPNSLKSDSIK